MKFFMKIENYLGCSFFFAKNKHPRCLMCSEYTYAKSSFASYGQFRLGTIQFVSATSQIDQSFLDVATKQFYC